MGWSTSRRRKGETMTQTLINDGHLKWSDPSLSHTYTVIGSAFIGLQEHYAAVEMEDKATGVKQVFCCISKIHLFKEDKQGYNYSVKSIGSWDSCFINCPEKILALLSPATDPGDIAWRQMCRDKAESRKGLKLTAGTIFYTKTPISFTNGAQSNSFIVQETRGKSLVCMTNGEFGMRCRISRDYLLSRYLRGEVSYLPFEKPENESTKTQPSM